MRSNESTTQNRCDDVKHEKKNSVELINKIENQR